MEIDGGPAPENRSVRPEPLDFCQIDSSERSQPECKLLTGCDAIGIAGSLTLSDFRAARLRIACHRCHRRGDYSTARLIERHGPDYRLPDLLANLTANCPGRDGYSIRRCEATFPELIFDRCGSTTPPRLG